MPTGGFTPSVIALTTTSPHSQRSRRRLMWPGGGSWSVSPYPLSPVPFIETFLSLPTGASVGTFPSVGGTGAPYRQGRGSLGRSDHDTRSGRVTLDRFVRPQHPFSREP